MEKHTWGSLTPRRPQGNYHLLLPLHAPHVHLARRRRGRGPPGLGPLAVLHRDTERTLLGPDNLPPRQRLRRLPALRGRHPALRLAPPRLLPRRLRHLLPHLDRDLQLVGGALADQHHRAVRRGVPPQRDPALHLRRHAGVPRRAHAAGPVADGRHHLWRLLLRRGAGAAVRVQREDLHRREPLRRRAVLCDDVQPARRHDGLQGEFWFRGLLRELGKGC